MPATGILLVNLGSPDAPTPAALRRYLKEFLWDPRVVEAPRVLWWLVLNGIILNTRPAKSAKKYAGVWTPEGSPLLAITRRQAEALSARLGLPVEPAMRYGNPSVAAGIERLMAAGIGRILVLPLYPQYSATTTASVFDAVADALKARRVLPALRFVDDYHDHPAYIDALAASVREHWCAGDRGERLVVSFHGIPKRYADAGDPYPERCAGTARLLAEALGLREDEWLMTFQSRFGREEWLQPYTDVTLARIAGEGVRSVDVICPGFAADCLETLEEIADENREVFLKAGGEGFRYVPALNERQEHIAALADLAGQNLAGW